MKGQAIPLTMMAILSSACQTLPEGEWATSNLRSTEARQLDPNEYEKDKAACQLDWMQRKGGTSAVDTATALATAAIDEAVAPGIALLLHWRKRHIFARDMEKQLNLCMRSRGYLDTKFVVQ